MEKLIILTGPTGIGKTEISLQVAKTYNCQIISADSMQIYKRCDIGTDKISIKNTEIKHYMIDEVEPWENYSVATFQEKAKKIITELNNKNILPLVVGGTGLYINSLVYNLNFSNVSADKVFRQRLNKLADENGTEYIFNKLYDLDKTSALNIDKNNRNRIIRALEINKFNGNKANNFREKNDQYELIFLGLYMNREDLYKRINNRVDQMISKGLVDEVQNLINMGLDKNSQSLNAIGYKEVVEYLNKKIDYYTMIDEIKKHSRHYAKRQITWFKRDDRIKWFDRQDPKCLDLIIKYIGEKCEKIL